MDESTEIKSQCLSFAVSRGVGSQVSAQAFESRVAGPYEKVVKERSEDDARGGAPRDQCAEGSCTYDDGDTAEVRGLRCGGTVETKEFKCVQESVSVV